ncbi:Villin headpiece [Trinorchestia longiramus]|nr:Villin headpiece [Trinorchestia longiramus]
MFYAVWAEGLGDCEVVGVVRAEGAEEVLEAEEGEVVCYREDPRLPVKTERVNSQALAVEYIKTDPRGRSPDTPIILIKQGFEPPNFTGFFGVWDNDLWNNNMTYGDICERLQQSSPGCTMLVTPSRSKGDDGQEFRKTYPMAILRIRDGDKLPDDIDPTRKEDYMSDDDFSREFGMDRETFSSLPDWKRQNLKKKIGIY